MKPRNLIFLTILLTFMIACNGNTRPTPTPFAENDATEQALLTATPQEISITDLATDPEAYANTFLEISGRYRRLPLLVCNSDPHPAPATWQLQAEDGSFIAVGGLDSQVRSLLPNDLTMTVAGVWQLFEGPVGCGKNAAGAQIWYLKVSHILSPSPIAQVTLTPTGSGIQIAEVDGETAVATPGSDDSQPPSPDPEATDDALAGTPPSPATPGGGSGGPTATVGPPADGSDPTAPASPPGDEDDEQETATPTNGAAATPTVGNGTPTPTSVSGGNGGTTTATPSSLSTATRNPNESGSVEFDPLSPETPVLELLAADEIHLWPISFDYDGAITITAVAEPTMNLVLEIIDPNSSVVQQANNTGNGGLEMIINAQLNVALNYKIRVYDLNASQGDYCLIFNEGGGFPDMIRGRIDYNQTVTSQVDVLGIDYWCFLGSSGHNVSIMVSPTGSSGDFVLGLFGPPNFEASGSVFQDDTITNITLAENSMYLIGVLDFEAGASGYSLNLTRN